MKQIKLGNKDLYALIDDEDFACVVSKSWVASTVGSTTYAVHHVHQGHRAIGKIYLHRFILDAPAGFRVDHKDGNGLNNTRSNLRLSTVSQNAQNSRVERSNNRSGYKGVSFDKQTGKWRASLTINRKIVHFGRFDDIKDAARAYNQGAVEYFGEFAQLNKI